MRGDISLADLYRAIHALAPDEEAVKAITRLLDLEHAPKPVVARLSGAFDASQSPERRESRQSAQYTRVTDQPIPPEEPVSTVFPVELRSLRDDHAVETAGPPAWLRDPAVVAIPAASPDPEDPPKPDPLFAPLRARAILGAALSVSVPEGELDVEKLAEDRAVLRAVGQLPRLSVPTVRYGAQLLLDYAESMAPYRADRSQIASDIAQVAGRSRVNVLRFRGRPMSNVEAPPDFRPRNWAPPPRKTVIAIVTDFGIGAPPLSRDAPDPEEWVVFARRAQSAGCPLVAFVPFGPHRWDPKLARLITMVQWDRATTARAVVRALRDQPERM